MPHWTEENADAFAHKLAFDFITQIEKKIVSQTELADRLGVTEGAVSKVLNNPQNLTLKTISKYARALGLKAAIVAYDDDDPNNEKGLIHSEIFNTCWEHAGKPRDVWSLDAVSTQQFATTAASFYGVNVVSSGSWSYMPRMVSGNVNWGVPHMTSGNVNWGFPFAAERIDETTTKGTTAGSSRSDLIPAGE